MTALDPETSVSDLRTPRLEDPGLPGGPGNTGRRWSDADEVRHGRGRAPREVDDSDAHLLRLCLDLQLDALLLTLGAGAAQRVREDSEPGWMSTGSLPWRRWVEEDLDLAEALASDAMAGHATLPSTLGTEHDHRMPEIALDNLLARYESMRDLLTDLLDRDDVDPDDARDGWRPRIREALHRCQTRLVELREYRLTGTPPLGLRLDLAAMSGTGSPLAPEHRYLPGELLG